MEERWLAALEDGEVETAWDRFLDRYRRLILATIRRYAADYDDVMGVFAHACEALHADDLARLRKYADLAPPRPRCSTWLVAVIRNLTIDWFRHRDGRRRLSAIADRLPSLERRIFEYVFHEGRSHTETFELLCSRDAAHLTYREFLRALRSTYAAVRDGRRGELMRELAPRLPEPAPPALDDPAVSADRRERIAAAMTTLSPEDRLTVQLYVVDGLPAAEVARLVGHATAKVVYNRTYRALESLREALHAAGVHRGDL